jgi:hypothetical protein
MDKPEDGGAAFPYDNPDDGERGMSLRDYFAGQVIGLYLTQDSPKIAARLAYKLADDMIEARNLSKEQP